MKPISEQDYYEILELPRDAGSDQIERSYKLALSTYSENSLAGYSVFGDGDAELLRAQVETAYRVLSDPDRRAAYDASLAAARGEPGATVQPVVPAAGARPAGSGAAASGELAAFDDLDAEREEFDGPCLRRARLQRGLDIGEIARVTKINPNYLLYLEEERFADLPAPVYVRGFVTGYATCLGLDARRVADSYMHRYEENRAQTYSGRPYRDG